MYDSTWNPASSFSGVSFEKLFPLFFPPRRLGKETKNDTGAVLSEGDSPCL